jgi:endo-1,4-beta-xylanase
LQNHNNLNWPTANEEDATISAFEALGLKVAISELDINVLPNASHQPTADITLSIQQNKTLNPYADGLPDSVQRQLAARYAELFRVFLKHRGTIMRVTFWNVTDGDSWLNNSPVRGRANYPLLFDRKGEPKPAFNAVIRVASQKQPHD